jgi:hypothetical protein
MSERVRCNDLLNNQREEANSIAGGIAGCLVVEVEVGGGGGGGGGDLLSRQSEGEGVTHSWLDA